MPINRFDGLSGSARTARHTLRGNAAAASASALNEGASVEQVSHRVVAVDLLALVSFIFSSCLHFLPKYLNQTRG